MNITQIKGMSFPFSFNANGSTNTQTALDKIGANLKMIAITMLGERIYRPTFGNEITKYQFRKIDLLDIPAIKQDLKLAFNRFEPRAVITNIEISKDSNNGIVYVNIDYGVTQNGLQLQTSNITFSL
jgi:phage baseplate assembly protein W